MDQTARIEDGSRNIIVQAVASTVTVGLPPQLRLSPRHRRKHRPKSDIDLLNPFTDAIPFIGREADLARLHDWLSIPKPISVRCLASRTGSDKLSRTSKLAGVGKTRLALQLCERAEALTPAWDAGFAEHRELERFASLQNLSAWGWQRPTLIVVDYASGAMRWLRPWLEELAQNPGFEGVPLRLLLLERFADPNIGWWADLTRTGQSNARMAELFDPPAPEPLPPIGAEHRTAIVGSIMQRAEAAEMESSPSRAARVERLAGHADDDATVLDLLMAGLTAARGLGPTATGQPASRVQMASALAGHELKRIEVLAKDRAIEPKLLAHMTAVVTMQGGADLDDARQAIEAEMAALPFGGAAASLQVRNALRDALPAADGARLAPILPDLVGEAVILRALGGLTAREQEDTIARCYRRAETATLTSVMHTAQDFADSADHPALGWLDVLAERCDSLTDFMQLADAFPHQTLALRDRAAAITAAIVEHLRSSAEGETDPAVVGVRGRILNNLSVRLGDLGRREAALAAIEEAVAVYRELAALRPDAFRPDLARSLSVLGDCHEAVGDLDAALKCDCESVAFLSGYFARWPQSYAHLMRAICTGYLRRCEAAGVEPDIELLAPVAEVFDRFQNVDAEASEDDGRQA